MYMKNRGLAWAMLSVVAFMTACGPVKFSSSSEANLDPSGITPTPTPDTSPTPTATLRDVRYNNTVVAKNYKLDLVLVIDDSNSMLADNRKLADRLSNLITKLGTNNIDWQMCATVTRGLPTSGGGTAWGASYYWQPAAISSSAAPNTSLGMVLKKGTPNVADIVKYTIDYIDAGWAGSDDERGIKAAYRHVYNGDLRYSNNGCYRADSAVAYIIISDEDVRSIGGDASQQVYQGELKALEEEDKPQVFVDFFKSTFGADRRFTVNSIIVKPGDTNCKDTQDAQGAKSHYGFRYAELSNLTGGGIGSICDSDYSANMDLFFGRINSSLSSVPLECSPYNGVATVTLTPAVTGMGSSVQGASVVFSSPVPAGTNIDIRYQCLDRAPSSFGEATMMEQPGFFARIWNFIKGLF